MFVTFPLPCKSRGQCSSCALLALMITNTMFLSLTLTLLSSGSTSCTQVTACLGRNFRAFSNTDVNDISLVSNIEVHNTFSHACQSNL